MKKLIIDIKDLEIPNKLKPQDINKKRNEILAMLGNILEDQAEWYRKYKDALGKIQEIKRKKHRAEAALLELHKIIREQA